MENKKVLISGAGIAGPTLAWWLNKYGFHVTVLEKFPDVREGGYLIDFWGVGYNVAEKMGILDELTQKKFNIDEVVFVGDSGKRKGGINIKESAAVLDGRLISLLRSDLARTIYSATKDHVEYIFGDEISQIEQNANEVAVTFQSGNSKSYDLVVGADGLHSNVRQLVFGKHEQFERYFGYYVSTFTIDNFFGNEPLTNFKMYSMPDKQVSVLSSSEGKITLLAIFKQEPQMGYEKEAPAIQKEILKNVFKDAKWECSRIFEKLDTATDFYFDSVSQVAMEHWSKDRVVLLGDAAFCPSLLSGQGAALAMAGAYVLAGELCQACGDYTKAFNNYENIFKPFVEKKQKTAETFMNSFVPPSNFKIWLRNQLSRFMSIPFFSRLFWKRFLIDPIKLKNYVDIR